MAPTWSSVSAAAPFVSSFEAQSSGCTVTTPYYNSPDKPGGGDGSAVPPNGGEDRNLMPADVSNEWHSSHTPWDQGLVHYPEVPEMPVLPGSSNATCAIHWAITAEAATALADGSVPDGTMTRRFTQTLLDRFSAAKRATAEDLLSVAPRIAERIISGGWISVKGSNGGVPSEANHVANGLWMTNLRAWSLRLSALLTC